MSCIWSTSSRMMTLGELSVSFSRVSACEAVAFLRHHGAGELLESARQDRDTSIILPAIQIRGRHLEHFTSEFANGGAGDGRFAGAAGPKQKAVLARNPSSMGARASVTSFIWLFRPTISRGRWSSSKTAASRSMADATQPRVLNLNRRVPNGSDWAESHDCSGGPTFRTLQLRDRV